MTNETYTETMDQALEHISEAATLIRACLNHRRACGHEFQADLLVDRIDDLRAEYTKIRLYRTIED